MAAGGAKSAGPASAPGLAVPAKPALPPSPQIASAPVVAASVVKPVEAASAPSPVPAPTPAPVEAPPVAAPPVVASAPALPVASAPETVAAPSPAPAASRPKPVPAPAAEPSAEPGLLDNPFVLPGLIALLAGLGGLGFYRWRNRARKDSGETSFLESRLQPDSFFGVSGGQRIDTRDASGVSSSMSYSLSQLDAIGDVDPVAEADVYLAYGRDLQAEEILKEAMRSTPDRMAIRTKLLEVYAKRRDTKGFEQLATQLYGLTRGEGEDWAKAQELGRSIDPENPLYQPGGAPATPEGEASPPEPLGASTMPRSVLPTMPGAPRSPEEFDDPSGGGIDLDLDTPSEEQHARLELPEVTQPLTGERSDGPDSSLDFELPEIDEPRAARSSNTSPMEFDLDSMSLDLGGSPAARPQSPNEAQDLSDLDLPDVGGDDDESADPLVRKLELAEEFRQIGDMEGARDLIEEVIAKASGSLKAKAQGMLETLA